MDQSAPAHRRTDGRRLRSERTKQYIIEAYLALLRHNPRPPTASQIAERAGYSVRSLFERFPDLLSLSLAAADQAFAQANTQAAIRNANGDRAARIRTQVETRAQTCEDWLPLWRALVLNQQVSEELRTRIRRVREAIMARILLMYRPELDSVSHIERRRTLIAIEALTDFESWARMREAAGLSVEEACNGVDLRHRPPAAADAARTLDPRAGGRCLRPCPGGRRQGARRRSCAGAGVSSAQRAKACGQRSRKRQPDGAAARSGSCRVIGSGARSWSTCGTGTAATSACV